MNTSFLILFYGYYIQLVIILQDIKLKKIGISGTDSFFPFSFNLELKNIEYKKMERFCVSKFETRNSKRKK